ncbi:hypothetical protein EIP86_008489 [Pleurotus ostreatoroseus]|nr:hypothetical protein EIP86_008489 [Pleurotus ostreatoroseus]
MSQEGEPPSVYKADNVPVGDPEAVRISNAIDEELKTLDRERPSWRPIVYSNILRALRAIFDALDLPSVPVELDPLSAGASSSSSYSSSAGITNGPISAGGGDNQWSSELMHLRTKLLPLVASEDALAAELSGGIRVGGGRNGVYVRAGWQTLITPNRAWPVSDVRAVAGRPTVVTNLVGKTLGDTQDEVAALWSHPSVRKLVKSQKLRLEESAALYVNMKVNDWRYEC